MEDTELNKLRAPIPIEQVEFRVQSISEKGWALLLAYKDARVDMDRLDAAVGEFNWQRLHEKIDGANYCKVGIWDKEKEQWIWKQDVGTPSNQEAVKGEASDAFKRACFNWGIGRELYDYPLLLVELNEKEFTTDGDKAKASYDLKLKEWIWHSVRSDPDENGKTTINNLKAVDEKGNERFTYPRTSQARASQQSSQSQQSSSGRSKPDDKPWYDSLEEERNNLQAMVNKGAKPEELIKHLRKSYKVNKKTSEAILAMKAEPG